MCSNIKTPDVQGLYFYTNVNFDEQSIIQKLDENDGEKWSPLTSSSNSRVVQHFGYKYDYIRGDVTEKIQNIPDFLMELKQILTQKCIVEGLIEFDGSNEYFNQCIVNNYYPGQGISAHIDSTKYGDIIGCFTLCSGSNVSFTKDDKTVKLYTEPKSLYIMSGDSRHNWKHYMIGRKFDTIETEKCVKKIPRRRRISVTFRNVPV